MVVFHLHGQTSRSKAWANGTQNSRPWWISSRNHVYHLYKSDPFTGNDREGLKPVLKLTLKKWNTNFRLEYSARKNKTTFSDVSLLLQIFRWNDPKSRVPFTFQPDFRTILVNGKQPISLDSSWKFLTFILQLLCSHWSVTLFFPNVALLWSNETTVIPKSPLRNGTRVFYFLLVL